MYAFPLDRVHRAHVRQAITLLATAALAFSGLALAPHGRADSDTCVLIDTDLDIDDMMSMPMVVGNRHVAAVVTTEGFTTPELGAAATSRLLAEPGQRTIPVIVGAGIHRAEADISSSFGDFVLVFRELMNRLNNFLPAALPPTPRQDDDVQQILDAVATCPRVDVLLLGPFTSFVDYGPAIRSKIGRVVISGRPVTPTATSRPWSPSIAATTDVRAQRFSTSNCPGWYTVSSTCRVATAI